MAHHQEADGLQAQLAGQPEVLDRDVGLGAVGGDPADRAAVVLRLLDVLLGADTGQHQEGDLGFLGRLGRQLDQLLLGGLGEPVVEARPAQPVAVGDLDDRHAGGVQRRDDRADLVLGELVALVVRPVAQRRVGHPDVPDRVEEDVVGAHAWPPAVSSRSRFLGDLLADLGGRGGHDVQVARVRRQVVARTLDLDEGGDHRVATGVHRRLVELRLVEQPVAGHVGLHLGDHVLDRLR